MKNEQTRKIITYGLSLAASWAWGVSIIVGMETVQTKGYIPFVIWAVANSLALPLFGIIAFGIPRLHEIVDTKAVQLFTTCIMIFCLWIQMNAIYEKTQQLGLSAISCEFITIIIAMALTVGLFRDGLIRNILIDKALWCVCYLVLIIMLVYAQITNQGHYELVSYGLKSDLSWAWNTVPILFAGPIMNIQNWQMAHKLKDEGLLKRSHVVAGIFFGIYMVIVFLLAHYKFDSVLYMIQIAAILCITITTMDAAIVGMQRIAGAKIGLIIAMVTICVWRFVIPMGVLDLWTFMGNRRKEVAIVCIVVALGKYGYVDVFKWRKRNVSE